MESAGYASIFVSYAHEDGRWKDRFVKALRGALHEKATVWCDKDIDGGIDWEHRIADELKRAEVALVLASGDYLESEWPRRELKWICRKFQEKSIRYVFWVLLQPCAWKQTELAAFQRPHSAPSDSALNELSTRMRAREILYIVEEISSAVEQIKAARDPKLTYVRAILGEEGRSRNIRIEKLLSNAGDHTIVCRGRDGAQHDVAIKITRRSSIRGIPEELQKAAERRTRLRDPGFIRLHDNFLITSPDGDQHLVLVTEYFEGMRLRDALTDEKLKHRFTTDRAVTLIRRAAEAINELHALECGEDGVCTEANDLAYGPMIPEHLFYDERLDRVRFAALSVNNFAWDAMGWESFAMLVDRNSVGYVVPEHMCERPPPKIDKLKIDQYMLGQLAVEILDGKLPLPVDANASVYKRKEAIFDQPLKYAGPWKTTHSQLERIIARMLARYQDARFSGMAEIVTQLKSVEGEQRALAKATYLKWIDNDERFFEEFYARFFASMAARGVDSQAKFANREQQNDKLRKGMAAVLNFYPGNEPTSLRYVIDVHRNRGVTEAELVQFQASFLELLRERLDARMAPDDEMAGRKAEIHEAWRVLFGQVVRYFLEQGVHN